MRVPAGERRALDVLIIMLKRVVGTCLAVAGIASIAYEIRGIADSVEMASFLAEASRAYEKQFNQADWLHHWRVASAVYLVGSLLVTLSGVGLFFRKRWSLALLGGAVLGLLTLELLAIQVGYARYAFEQNDPEFRIALLLVGAGSLVLFARERRSAERPVAGV